MASTRTIHLVDPSPDEVLGAVPARLDPDAVEALATPAGDGRGARPTLESHGTYLLAVLLFPGGLDDSTPVAYRELDVVATAEAIATVRKTGPDGRLLELPELARGDRAQTCGHLFHLLVDACAEAYLDLVDELHVAVDGLEDHVDELSPTDLRRRLSELRHEMLHARRNASATRAAVRRIVDDRLDLGEDDALFPREVERAFADTYDSLARAVEELDVVRDLLASVRDFLQSKVVEAQNRIVQKLTVIASLVLVPTLITGFYGQNFANVFDDPFWSLGASLGLIAASTLVQLAFFRWRRWL